MRIDTLRARLASATESTLRQREQWLKELSRTLAAHHPARQVLLRLDHLARLRQQLDRAARRRLDDSAQRLARLRGLLRTLGPESAFERGFSITLDARGKIIRSIKEVAPDDKIRTKLKDGEIRSLRG
jgi:exodeoxyribonuclease VII large subunit